MNSVKCSACGFVGWGGVEVCKKCGAKLVPHSPSSVSQSPSFADYQSPEQRPNGQLKTGLAIASLVIGILNFFTLGFLGLGIILGVTLAAVALSKIKQHPTVYGGKEFAIAGLVTSLASILVIVPIAIIAAIAIPNLLASRRAANEGSAVQAIKKITAAEYTYSSMFSTYGTLEQLGAQGLISKEIAAGSRWGYLFKINVTKPDSRDGVGRYQVLAVPLTYPSSGRRSFYMDESGVIRGGDAHGKDATEFDDPLRDTSSEYPSREPAPRGRDPVTDY